MDKTIVELFAGVGGFRVGFNDVKSINKNGHAIEKHNFKFVRANQREPSTKTQHAFDCYKLRFNCSESEVSNEDISKVNKALIPDHSILVGGFPCQDYSVAHSLNSSKGIEGKKGVLWWQINEILSIKKPPFVLLENVDRLLKSPAKQRGRDFAIMLRCFYDLGYAVEWRVINAADYGHPQRRRRIFIFAYNKSTNYYQTSKTHNYKDILEKEGVFAKKFAIKPIFKISKIDIINGYNDLVELSDNFQANFENAGYMIDGQIYTSKTEPIYEKQFKLSKIVESNTVDEHFFLSNSRIKKFEYLRGSKKIKRIDKNGHEYFYSEGSMSPYDDLDLPGRTMLTSEGTTNRSTHIIKDPLNGNLRILTPIECERLNQFPDNRTNSGMPEKRRYFMMGNALVCGIINKLSKEIGSIIEKED